MISAFEIQTIRRRLPFALWLLLAAGAASIPVNTAARLLPRPARTPLSQLDGPESARSGEKASGRVYRIAGNVAASLGTWGLLTIGGPKQEKRNSREEYADPVSCGQWR